MARGLRASTVIYHLRPGDTALRLGHYFGINVEFWLNLQNLYQLRVAEYQVGGDIGAASSA
jgi:plasmid maintenance system antidote protein VapI